VFAAQFGYGLLYWGMVLGPNMELGAWRRVAMVRKESPRSRIWRMRSIAACCRRSSTRATLENRQAMERAIAAGQAGCYLRLTPDQYARLKRA
jgi:hypothetical protein